MAALTALRLALVFCVLLLACAGGLQPAAAQIAPADRDSWPTTEWQTAAPEAQGMDPALLAAADARVRADQPYITSLLVIRGGDIVFEQYYDAFAATDTTQIWSATKSFTATIVGIAIDEGLLTLDQTVGELIPDRIPAEADPRAATVTVRQLLTMTSGFTWVSNTDFRLAYDEVDQTARTLGLPFACDPGTCYEYNSGNVQVLSSIVQAVTGQTLAAYAQPRLFDPLGIAPPPWDTAVTGETLGAVGLHLTSRDFAKLGFLYLNGGVWDGQQVVSNDWVTAATSIQSSGVNAEGVSLGGGSTGYGYLWWTDLANGSPAYHAIGVGAQVLYVAPALDLVAVATTSNAIPNEVPISEQQYPKAIIEELIVPAASGPVADPSLAAAAQAATPAVAEEPTATPTPPEVPTPVPAPIPAATPVGAGRTFALPGDAVFPEGIAYDAATGDFYTGSIIDGAIYRGNVTRGTVEVFLPASPGRVAFGLALDGQGRLFVAGGETGAVAVYDTQTGERLLDVANGLAPNTHLNDVAVSPAGDAFITDSFNPLLWRIPASAIPAGPGTPAPALTTDPIEAFVDFSATGLDLAQPGFNATGIVATPDGRYLLLAQANTGNLYRVDSANGETIQIDLGEGSLPGGDGLALDGQTLYVAREGQITVVTLEADYSRGVVGGSFSEAGFADPTSLAQYDGCLLVVNSQFTALQGQPQLPFTISAAPIPPAALGPEATPVAAAQC